MNIYNYLGEIAAFMILMAGLCLHETQYFLFFFFEIIGICLLTLAFLIEGKLIIIK